MPVFSRKMFREDVDAFLTAVMDAAMADESGETQIIALAPSSMNAQPGSVVTEVYEYRLWYWSEKEITLKQFGEGLTYGS